jgi:hypothetical protein
MISPKGVIMENKGLQEKPGVYKIRNKVSEKLYIGSSVNVYRRFYRHRQVLREELLENLRIKEDCEKYGIDSFEFEVIEYCEKDILKKREQFYFEKLCPQYNVWKSVYSATDREYTDEQIENFKKIKHPIKDKEAFKKKLKIAWITRKAGPDFKEKHGNARRGISHSEETKLKMSMMRKGKTKSSEWKVKIGKSKIGKKLINGKYIYPDKVV